MTGDPGLAAFEDDGTPGNGHFPLLQTSPAVDGGDILSCTPTDQLGQSRVDGDLSGSVVCDIGAVEFFPTVVLNGELQGTFDTSTFTFDPTPVEDGPAGTFSFVAKFCNFGSGERQFTNLKSVTTTLSNGNVLLNRDSGTPPGVGSELTLPAVQGLADGVLSFGECVDVPYRIGLAVPGPFTFFVDILGIVR
jgi:hypothetical protein